MGGAARNTKLIRELKHFGDRTSEMFQLIVPNALPVCCGAG